MSCLLPTPCSQWLLLHVHSHTYILSSMQYTAEGSDLLGAFTRATFCTVVSSSPRDREVVIPSFIWVPQSPAQEATMPHL